jgi:hypothetical protein
MRLMAFHDSEGNITGLVVSSPEASPVQLVTETQPGLRMTEIEAPPEVTLDLDSPRLNEDVDILIENYRVEIPSDKGRLMRKPDAAAEQS